MELTPEQTQKMMNDRFSEYPQFGAIGRSPELESTLSQILQYEEVDPELLPIIVNEVRVVLSLYAPLSHLSKNIAESCQLPTFKANGVATLVKALILGPVLDDLMEYELLWNAEMEKANAIAPTNLEAREPLELRPEGQKVTVPQEKQDEPPRPLTHQELMEALASRRTMASDIEALREKREADKAERVIGYEALQKRSDE